MGRKERLPEEWRADFLVIGHNVRRVLKAKDLTAYKLAQRVSTSTTSIYRQLNDGREPELTTLLKWSVALGVDINELLVGVNAEYDVLLTDHPSSVLSRHTPVTSVTFASHSQGAAHGESGQKPAPSTFDEQTDLDEAVEIVKRTTSQVDRQRDGQTPNRTESTEARARRVRRHNRR